MSAGSHARALAKHQRGMAIQILTGCPAAVTFHDVGTDGVTITAPRLLRMDRGIPEHAILAMLDGRGTFDVHAVRAYARELIAIELERVAFVDWCMDQGVGPDNREPGALVGGCEWCEDGDGQPGSYALVSGTMPQDEPSAVLGPDGRWRWRVECDRCNGARGGWPGRFAKAWGTVQCAACNGRRGARLVQSGPYANPHPCDPTWVWCKPCAGTGRTPKHGADRRAPMGRSLARMGQRLLDALKGQPDECQADDCERGYRTYNAYGDTHRDECPDCHGTGHNLRGMLPPVEITPQLRRRIREIYVYRSSNHGRCWLDTLDVHPGYGVTRVVHRGDHLHRGVRDPDHDLDRRISERLWDVWGDDWHEVPLPPGVHGPRKRVRKHPEPSWRRGLRVHAQQRRDRAAE